MRTWIVFLCVAFASPALAVERQPARLGRAEWVVGAQIAEDVDRVCFVRDAETLACAGPTDVVADEFALEGRRFKVLSPTGLTRAAIARLVLPASAQIAAIACRTVEGFDLCSSPSTDVYVLSVIAPPSPPRLIDVERISESLDAIDGAVRRIRDELETSEQGG